MAAGSDSPRRMVAAPPRRSRATASCSSEQRRRRRLQVNRESARRSRRRRARHLAELTAEVEKMQQQLQATKAEVSFLRTQARRVYGVLQADPSGALQPLADLLLEDNLTPPLAFGRAPTPAAMPRQGSFARSASSTTAPARTMDLPAAPAPVDMPPGGETSSWTAPLAPERLAWLAPDFSLGPTLAALSQDLQEMIGNACAAAAQGTSPPPR